MDGHLRDRFDEAVAGDPGLAPGALARAAMAEGGRIRRRRTGLTAAGAAVLVVAAGGLAVANLPRDAGPPPVTIAAAMLPAPASSCSVEPVEEGATDLAVFLGTAATERQRAAVEAAVHGDTRIGAVVFESRQSAHQRFVSLWADNPELVAAIDASQFPDSFRLRLVAAEQDAAVRARLAAMPGVEQIIGHRCPVDAPVGGLW
ncbi:hypothetical protein Aph02nite_27720 [Actinoplanes philippinensis]|uniref:FtsX extracellular domain-containing protein n=1 Tax=Actinoplanes philippinensis TaxID=35752 RepID=A0A1I2GDS0_9ACTN|nr:permease-like cell division protein FtsX [Actinoplanes philippinensis]GIE76822.1 hypothetical protein Aph02nite_27720 [Actinoplanes philippinensis]SFF15130.1 hypothetical protein SAMN05421541_106427 [Actinoplanes philippinensis]